MLRYHCVDKWKDGRKKTYKNGTGIELAQSKSDTKSHRASKFSCKNKTIPIFLVLSSLDSCLPTSKECVKVNLILSLHRLWLTFFFEPITGAAEPSKDTVSRVPAAHPDGAPIFTNTTVVDHDASAPPPKASETLVGPTSQEIHDSQGLGKPAGGMSSAEMRHDGMSHRKKEGFGGAEQWGSKRAEELKAGEDERGRDFEVE